MSCAVAATKKIKNATVAYGMRKLITKKHVAVVFMTICVVVLSYLFFTSETPLPTDLTREELAQVLASRLTYHREGSYAAYLVQHSDADRPDDIIPLLYNGVPGRITGDTGFYQWSFVIDRPGLYNIFIVYRPILGTSGDIQRSLYINDEIPFIEAEFLVLSRVWINEDDEFRIDTQGNDLRPRQVESFEAQHMFLRESMGHYTEPLLFYFEHGENTIALRSIREPMEIISITLTRAPSLLTYEDTLRLHRENGLTEATGYIITIEAESAQRKSTPMLHPVSDRSSPAVSPYSARYIRYNTIGGFNWRSFGQWIEWDVFVPESGLYHIAFNARQNFIRGVSSFRRLTINGEVPFIEAQSLAFPFHSEWRVVTLGMEDEPYLFYLNAGLNTIRMEAVLGDLADIIRIMEDEVLALNRIYRQLVMVIGTEPDVFRDYQIEAKMPWLPEALAYHRDVLLSLYSLLIDISGGSGQRDTVMRTMATTLDLLQRDVEMFTRRLQLFRTDLGALGTWLLHAAEQPLQLDMLHVIPPGEQVPVARATFWNRLVHEFLLLFYSFIIDYSSIGNISHDTDMGTITVWVGTGRDQANTIKSLIDERFTPDTGINVNLMLTQMDTLLPATMSGQGPDVAMQVGGDMPMNFGLRGAVHDISHFPDFEEVIMRFPEAAMVPFNFEGRSFALPETFSFNMMFYRRDILHELGIDLPNTWDDVNAVIAQLSVNNLSFSLSPAASADEATMAMGAVTNTFAMFLYQHGGEFYTPDNRLSALDSDIASNAFRQLAEYYTDFGLEIAFDFVNRFRTGESPLGVVDYTTYNTLQIFAPEIRGLWGFTVVPGTMQADGSINRSTPGGGSAVVIMEQADDHDLAWEFLKWWTSAEIQTQYGREMEALMGPAARHPTANLEALSNMPWPIEHYRAMQSQLAHVVAIPQIPGGYFTPRHVYNAFAEVVILETRRPREALMAHVRHINAEIAVKRAEFNLD